MTTDPILGDTRLSLRWLAGSGIVLAVGLAAVCCSADVPSRADRTRLAIEAAQIACAEYLRGTVPVRVAEAEELCPLLVGPPATPHAAEDDSPVSGDGGPMNVEQGNATRRVEDGGP